MKISRTVSVRQLNCYCGMIVAFGAALITISFGAYKSYPDTDIWTNAPALCLLVMALVFDVVLIFNEKIFRLRANE